MEIVIETYSVIELTKLIFGHGDLTLADTVSSLNCHVFNQLIPKSKNLVKQQS